MAHGTVRGRLLLSMAVHAPAHVITTPDRVPFAEHAHLLNFAMARLARDVRVHVAHVGEVGMIRDLIDTHPGDRLIGLDVALDLLDFFGIVLPWTT